MSGGLTSCREQTERKRERQKEKLERSVYVGPFLIAFSDM